MINVDELGARVIFVIHLGKVDIGVTESTIIGFFVAVFIAIMGIWLGSNLKKVPKGKQIFAEFVVGWVYKFTEKNLGKQNLNYAPYVGTLFAFIFLCSAMGIFGFRPVTADLNVTAALAIMTFVVILVSSIKRNGIIKHGIRE